MQIDSLDGLRGIAVLLVIFSHMSHNGLNMLPGLDFRGAGRYGVFLFFVLSAFLLTLPPVRKTGRDFFDIRFWTIYIIRRFLRIFPAYIVFLLINLICNKHFHFPYFLKMSIHGFWQFLVLSRGDLHLWTVPVEFKYYLVLPFVVLLFVVVCRKHVLMAMLAVAAYICFNNFVLWPAAKAATYGIALWPYISIFLMGSLTALIHSRIHERGGFKSDRVRNILEAVACVTFACVILLIPHFWESLTGRSADLMRSGRPYFLFGLLWSIFLFSLLNGRGVIRRVLESYPLRFVGIVSFSAYLWHVWAISFLEANVHTYAPLVMSLVILLTLFIATVSYVAFERPLMRIDFRKIMYNK